MKNFQQSIGACLLLLQATTENVYAFHTSTTSFAHKKATSITNLNLAQEDNANNDSTTSNRRRQILKTFTTSMVPFLITSKPQRANAGNFTPGGTLVDRDVGVQVSNNQASSSRKADNANVLFTQDHYFKFGTAAPWIEPDTTEFPKTMPFVLSQQRYDALKKYGSRVKSSIQNIVALKDDINNGNAGTVPNADDGRYGLRPFGLLANGFLGSENTGTTNELLLARWYINEIYLRINDVRSAKSQEEAMEAYDAALKAINSYLSMLNRVITAKVGDKFEYV